jgi:hypothetical protein
VGEGDAFAFPPLATLTMTADLFSLISDEHAQALVGGCGDVDANADFVNGAHNLGCCHQANNAPGDTAADRHNFADAANPAGQNVNWANANRSGR